MDAAKEKAKEIFDKFNSIKMSVSRRVQKQRVIQCSLIEVKAIIDAIFWHEFETPNEQFIFWTEVNTELNKMKI